MGERKLNICIRQPSSKLFIRAEEDEHEVPFLFHFLCLISCTETCSGGVSISGDPTVEIKASGSGSGSGSSPLGSYRPSDFDGHTQTQHEARNSLNR